jgi:L-ornithine N5-oxygenase
VCIKEYVENNDANYNLKFFERKSEFGWHTGMQLPNTYLQVSFLKDLVTQRNPRSKYTFLNFLHEKNRLHTFINFRQFEPSRIEFQEYLKWVASDFEDDVEYNHNLKSVTPNVEYDGSVKTLTVEVENIHTKEIETYTAKNISLALGSTPNVPNIRNLNNRVTHSFNFKPNIDKILKTEANKPMKFAIVGAGQSAIEMLLYIYTHFPNVEIDSIFSGFKYQQSDSSLFVNEVFFNENVNTFYDGNPNVKKVMMQRNTNYAVVDEKELEALYRISYEDSLLEKNRIHFKNFSKVTSIDASDDGVELKIFNCEKEDIYYEKYDYVFLGTGFKKHNLQCLEGIKEYLLEDEESLDINRDYSLKTDVRFEPKIFLIGHSEEKHGLTNTLLSVNALRSEEVTKSLMAHKYQKLDKV